MQSRRRAGCDESRITSQDMFKGCFYQSGTRPRITIKLKKKISPARAMVNCQTEICWPGISSRDFFQNIRICDFCLTCDNGAEWQRQLQGASCPFASHFFFSRASNYPVDLIVDEIMSLVGGDSVFVAICLCMNCLCLDCFVFMLFRVLF